jgi:hypothetical protein
LREFWIRRLRGFIEDAYWKGSYQSGTQSLFLRTEDPAIRVDALPTDWSAVALSLGFGSEHSGFSIEGGLRAKFEDSKWLQSLTCQPAQKFPKLNGFINLHRFSGRKETMGFDGKVIVRSFGGALEFDNLKLYHLDTSVPETQFQAKLSQLDLRELSKYLNFGEMSGLLEGEASDVVIQGWLPTQYQLHFEAKPERENSQIVFSADAMRNFVSLFAGRDLTFLPGVADWLAFGWPSRLLGGYNIDYLGVRLLAQNGWIRVETLDPEEVVRTTGKHFVLYGPRFKMPLESPHYPLILDASAMGNFARRVADQIRSISDKKKSEANATESKESETPNASEETPETCLPPVLTDNQPRPR